MAFPESERVVYSKNPLVQVSCGLRFPPILSIVSKQPADFQEKIRAVYPLYQTAFVLSPPTPQQTPQLAVPSALPTVHRFLSEDQTAEIDLASDFVSIGTRKYRRWEDFQERIVLAMNALEAIYHPPFYTHVELRYQDVIDRNELGLGHTPWRELIQSHVIGLIADPNVGDLVESAQSHTLMKLGNNESMNLIQTVGNQFQIGNQLVRKDQQGNQNYAIDAAFFISDRRTSGQVPIDLGRFNREAGYFFRWAITSKLRDALQPVSL
jgi:uncharacterized protein (TIGR04255 family)